MSATITAALDEAGKVVKKQKTCETKVAQSLDSVIALVAKARDKLASGSVSDPSALVSDLSKQIEELGFSKDLASSTKELHGTVNKLSKVTGAPDHSQD